jgi:hypothetical protein
VVELVEQQMEVQVLLVSLVELERTRLLVVAAVAV